VGVDGSSAEQKTNPRLMESIGNIDLVPATRRDSIPCRRVGGGLGRWDSQTLC